MPANKPYSGEDPVAARKRIAANKARSMSAKNPGAVKTKSDLMANILPSAKNLGY